MGNTKNLLLVAAITSLLVIGTSLVQMQSYADKGNDDHKKHKDAVNLKKSIQKDVESKSANQRLSQDNECYRGDGCQQANEGQQVAGEDNEAKGFNDQSGILSLPTPSVSGNSTG
jgi:hypothetical protein